MVVAFWKQNTVPLRLLSGELILYIFSTIVLGLPSAAFYFIFEYFAKISWDLRCLWREGLREVVLVAAAVAIAAVQLNALII